MTSWRTSTALGGLGGAVVGAADALHVVLAGRLGLGAVGVTALIGAGVVAGALLGLLLAGVVALWPRARSAGPEAHALVGAVGALAARLGVGAAVGPAVGGLGLPAPGVVVATVTLAAGLLLVGSSGRLRHGRRALLAAAAVVALAIALGGGRVVPVGQPTGPERPDVVLVTIAGVRADRYGSNPIDTPAFDRLAAEGTSLDLVVAPGGRVPAVVDDLLHARPPVPGIADPDVPPSSLAAVLHDQGYATGAFLAAPFDAAITADFDVVDDDAGWPIGLGRTLAGLLLVAGDAWHPEPERRAHQVVDRAIRFVSGRPGAYFAWVHLQDPLPPFDPPVPWDERYAPADAGVGGPPVTPHLGPEHGDAYEGVSDPRVVEARYDGEVASADAQVARLLAALDQAGRATSTLVVLVGVEGMQLAEGDPWFGRSDALTEGVLHTAAALRLPGRIPAGEVVRSPVELADVGATVLDLLGLAERGGGAVSLVPTIEGVGIGRRFARARTPESAAVRLPGALLTWSRDRGYHAERIDREAQDARSWTEDRVRDELSRLPGEPPPPTDAEVADVLRTLQRRATSAYEASFVP